MIIDASGNLLQRINRDVGLQDESIYGTFEDRKGTLWLALDNGISRIETASALSQFTLQSGINTGVLSARRFNSTIYVGTTNGLLRYDTSKSFFDPVPGIPQNQIFNLLPDGDKLLVPGDGLFAIKNGKAITIRSSVSADLTISGLYISKNNPDLLMTGGQFGASVFTKKDIVSGVKGSEIGILWVASPVSLTRSGLSPKIKMAQFGLGHRMQWPTGLHCLMMKKEFPSLKKQKLKNMVLKPVLRMAWEWCLQLKE